MSADPVPNVPIDGQTWRRLLREVRLSLISGSSGEVRFMLGLLISLSLGISALNVLNSYVGRDFMTAIEHRDSSAFVLKAVMYIGVFLLSTVVAVFFRFSEERLGLLWRETLTRRLIDRYLARKIYFRLDTEGKVTNPDQRIAEDVRAFTTTTLSFVLMFLNASIAVLAFSGVLWSINPTLFIVAVIYALGGSYLTIILGRSLVGLNYNQLDKEANFRSDLIHVRENAEAVALLNRERRLKTRMLNHLDDLVTNFRLIIQVNRNLGFFTSGYNNLVQVIPALIVAPLFMRGETEFGVITQSAMAFAHLIGAFSLIVTNFQSISSFAAVVTRLGSLEEAIEEVGLTVSEEGNVEWDVTEKGGYDQGAAIIEEDGRVAYQNLTLRSPVDGHALIQALNVTLAPGQRVLILGANEEAKLALFRATAGIWEYGSGNIVRPSAGRIQFLPERPYMPPGTLRELLVHTGQEESVSDGQIQTILAALGLEAVLERSKGLYTQKDWDNVLTLSEQQLLAFARLFLAAPDAVFLDRISSALNPDEVALVLGMLRERGITYLMLGRSRHGRRDTDDKLEYYDAILELNGAGVWKWKAVREGEFIED
jgi:putative ATP-binding cassette transporter